MGFVRNLTGKTAADAATKAADAQVLGAQEASQLFNPLAQVAQGGIDQAGFLTDPQAQFDFLQNNPLFQMGLDNANTQTNQFAAARGRLSAGDTLQQLNQNALLTAAPLIQGQKQSIADLLNLGVTTAGSQGNLRTGQAAATAGGLVGAANARTQGTENIVNLGGQIAAAFSDPSLKTNVTHVDFLNGFNIYTWDWNAKAILLGLFGSSRGVMADEVLAQNPEAITIDRGYMKVDYGMIGVNH